MKNATRLIFAAVLVGVLLVVAGGVWAQTTMCGTVPCTGDRERRELQKTTTVGGGGTTTTTTTTSGNTGGDDTVDMGTAIFDPQCAVDCTIEVVKVDDPATLNATNPADGNGNVLAPYGDVFTVTLTPDTETVQVCYAYPSEFEAKSAKLYRLNTEATPAAWVEVPGAVISGGTICATSVGGTFGLFGAP